MPNRLPSTGLLAHFPASMNGNSLQAISRTRAIRCFDAPATQRALAAMLVAAILPMTIGSASAASFTLTANSTSPQTLAGGETGALAIGKSLTVSGSAVGVTITGNNATINNDGTISQTGSARVVRDNTGVTGLTINNGSISNGAARMQAADADVIQMNKAGATVILNNYGSMISSNATAGGAQAVDFNAVTGANTINNFAGGLLKASEADAVRPGVNGVVFNAGTIRSTTNTGSSSDAIDGQDNSGISIINAATGVVDGARHGITGGAKDSSTPFSMSVTNEAGGIINGNNGSGLNLDGFNAKQVVTVTNRGTIIGNGVTGDGDGIDVDGLLFLTNTGTIRSVNAFSAAGTGMALSEGLTIGGGKITNSGLIEGLVAAGNNNAVGRGITLSGNDIAGSLTGQREGIYADVVMTNQAGGVIRGGSDSAIVAVGIASGHSVSITNNAGASIIGGGAVNAAIVTGTEQTTIINAGLINGAGSGKAIALGSASNAVIIIGGSASVIGSIDGGSSSSNTLQLNPGAGNSFAYSGAISNFNNVEVTSGSVTLSGVSSYTGTTRLSGGTLTLDGANRLAATSKLALDGGMLRLVNTGGANDQTFASLSLSQNSAIALGGSSLTFNDLGAIVAGKTLTFTEYVAANSGYAFRLSGDYSGNTRFLALLGGTTINGLGASYRFDGNYTSVSAVPEPATYGMLLAGMGMIGFAVRRRKPVA